MSELINGRPNFHDGNNLLNDYYKNHCQDFMATLLFSGNNQNEFAYF